MLPNRSNTLWAAPLRYKACGPKFNIAPASVVDIALPPNSCPFSNSTTDFPPCATVAAVASPAGPPPMIATSHFSFIRQSSYFRILSGLCKEDEIALDFVTRTSIYVEKLIKIEIIYLQTNGRYVKVKKIIKQ